MGVAYCSVDIVGCFASSFLDGLDATFLRWDLSSATVTLNERPLSVRVLRLNTEQADCTCDLTS